MAKKKIRHFSAGGKFTDGETVRLIGANWPWCANDQKVKGKIPAKTSNRAKVTCEACLATLGKWKPVETEPDSDNAGAQ